MTIPTFWILVEICDVTSFIPQDCLCADELAHTDKHYSHTLDFTGNTYKINSSLQASDYKSKYDTSI